jgi:hypothetical protein
MVYPGPSIKNWAKASGCSALSNTSNQRPAPAVLPRAAPCWPQIGLGDYRQARTVNEDTLARQRRVVGKDDRSTLTSASNLAFVLSALGDYEPARTLGEDTLVRRRRVLGEDHRDTLTSMGELACDLLELGDYEQARELAGDTLACRRRVLGEDHPRHPQSAENLADVLRKLGEAPE